MKSPNTEAYLLLTVGMIFVMILQAAWIHSLNNEEGLYEKQYNACMAQVEMMVEDNPHLEEMFIRNFSLSLITEEEYPGYIQ